MPIRTVKLMGKLWGDPANPASINVVWNGIPVFSGTATTVAGNFSYIDSNQLKDVFVLGLKKQDYLNAQQVLHAPSSGSPEPLHVDG